MHTTTAGGTITIILTKLLEGIFRALDESIVFERHRFLSRDQLDDGTIGQCNGELRTRAAINSEFQELHNMLRDKLVSGIVCDRPVEEKRLRHII